MCRFGPTGSKISSTVVVTIHSAVLKPIGPSSAPYPIPRLGTNPRLVEIVKILDQIKKADSGSDELNSLRELFLTFDLGTRRVP